MASVSPSVETMTAVLGTISIFNFRRLCSLIPHHDQICVQAEGAPKKAACFADGAGGYNGFLPAIRPSFRHRRLRD
jgi:hypothetical protein